jgi:hypothetical protein
VAWIDQQTQQALMLLDQQQAIFLRSPDLAITLRSHHIPAPVTDLVPTERLREIEAEFHAAAQLPDHDRPTLFPSS